jgi:deoxyribodipyrimidine photo-lyase
MNSLSPVIVWFRRDLRLTDHAALNAAACSGRPVIAVYIRDPRDPYAGANGAAQAWWLHRSLAALSSDIESLGNRLLLLSGDPAFVIGWLTDRCAIGLLDAPV